MGSFENMLRKALIFVAIIVFILAFISVVQSIFQTIDDNLEVIGGWKNYLSIWLWGLLTSFQQIGISLLCLFAAHKLRPFGGPND